VETIVIGHRNPDMDSICAAIGYARLKMLSGTPNVIAARAGDTNARVDYVLRKFGVPSPKFLSDVSPRVADVMERNVVSVKENSPVYEAINSIERYHLRGLPVTNEAKECLGLLSSVKVSQYLFPVREEIQRARYVRAAVSDVVRSFAGEVISGELEEEVRDYFLTVGGMSTVEFSRRFNRYAAEEMIVIVGDRRGIQESAISHGVRAVVITGGLEVDPEVRAMAEKSRTLLISSLYDTASTVLMARGGVRVSEMLDTDFESFSPNTKLEEAKRVAASSSLFVFPILNEEKRLVGVLSKSDFLKPVPRQLILVDHNELTQAVPGAEKVPIVEILDHHRLGGFATSGPIHFWNNPVGSTSTIVSLCFQQAGIEIPKDIAGLLMSGLISDTLNLTSPTATPTDGEVLRMLEEIAGVTADTLSQEIFSVGSPLLELSVEDAIQADCKEYNEEAGRFTVAQIEELGFAEFYRKWKDLQKALDASVRERGLLFAALMVTDIGTKNSLLLLAGSPEIRKAIDYPSAGHGLWELQGVVSRKKQLLPHILECLHKL
jgi:manganese-dependent inorganic pyrophosphatase